MTAKLSKLVLTIFAFAFAIGGAQAQTSNYPERPITMIVTFAVGGSSDVLARSVANAMSQGLGKPIVVENRPGAGGNIGAEAVSKAAPDGYTILFGTNGTLGIGPALYKNLRYNPQKDLVPVGLLHQLPLVLIVNPQVPANNLGELIAYAKSNPGKLTFASAGIGSASHLTAELFKIAADIDILHIPYKGGGAATADLVSGQVSMMLETIPNALAARAWRTDAGARCDDEGALDQRSGSSNLCGIRSAANSMSAHGPACSCRPERRRRSSTG